MELVKSYGEQLVKKVAKLKMKNNAQNQKFCCKNCKKLFVTFFQAEIGHVCQSEKEHIICQPDISIAKSTKNKNRNKAYIKQKQKYWEDFKGYTGKGISFTATDLTSYLKKLKSERFYSKSSLTIVRIGIRHGHNAEVEKSLLTENDKYSVKNSSTTKMDTSEFPSTKKSNHQKAYIKKRQKNWENFKSYTCKGINFTITDLEDYLKNLQFESDYSESTLTTVLCGIKHGFTAESGKKFKEVFPSIGENFAKNLSILGY